jgi:Calcineurin-like phosphoesterase
MTITAVCIAFATEVAPNADEKELRQNLHRFPRIQSPLRTPLMRIVCISDTHELHPELVVPPGDILIHAGDFTFFSEHPWMFHHFDLWLGELPHRHKIIIPGNHDYFLEEARDRSVITNATLLVGSGVEVEGLRIWGSAVTPHYGLAELSQLRG